MRIVELHPEELLDREASGALTAAERDALDAHAARCSACEYERRLRIAFADALREPPLSTPLVPAAPRAERGAERGAERAPSSEIRPRSRSARSATGWLAGIALFAVSVAAAQEVDAPGFTTRTSQDVEHAAVARTVERIRAVAAPVSARRAAQVHATRAARVAVSAQSLFDDANDARGRQDYETAALEYRRLQSRYPGSREAHISYVTMGRMQLDRADAVGALASFERYARSGDGALDDFAMAGRALALDDVGSPVAPGAWLALLRAHPDSPYASHARLRALPGVGPAL